MKQFLIYMDILGYEERAKEYAKRTGYSPEQLRKLEIDSIEGRLNELKASKVITKFNSISESSHEDAWLAFTDSSDGIFKTFKTVREVLKANVPLAIAIGVGEFDDSYLIQRRDETISYLKTGIIPKYERFYKDTHKESIKQTFVLLTPEVYKHLDSKRIYSEPYPSAGYYLADQKEFKKRLEVLEFLDKIGSHRTEYWEIEDLYVKPKNYNKIKGTLEKNHIVFIIGDAEMGKTYTAVSLLWEYSKQGYEPIYIPEERRQRQWEIIRHKMEFDGKAIYLEDPWGKVEFESAESISRDIGAFITEVKRKECKIIVTSREKVFEEFEKRKETAEDLWKYANRLKVNQAYNKENLIEMLKKYIHVFEPAWGEDKSLKKIALDAVGEKLRTPMSVKRLMDYSRDVGTENDLKAGIKKAAEDTKIAFANEIKEMFEKNKYDKLILLSLAYVGVNREAAEVCYEEVLSDSGYSPIKVKAFNDLMEEFREVEIRYDSLSYSHPSHEFEILYNRLSYIHPSYKDAFVFALADDGKPNNICKKIFSVVLFKLSEKCELNAVVVAAAVAENFDRLSEDIRNKLLFKLSEKGWFPSWYVAWAVARNFDRLPEDVRNKLLLKLSENDEAVEAVAWAVAENFDRLSEDVKNLLDKLQGQLQSVINNSLMRDKIIAIRLISNVRTKIDKGFALKILNELSKDKDKKVRTEAKALKSSHPFNPS